MQQEPATSARQAFRLLVRARRFVAPFSMGIAAALGLTAFSAAIDAVEPLLVKRVFDAVEAPVPARALLDAVLLIVAAAILRQLAGGLLGWITWRTQIGIQYTVQRETVQRLYTLPLAFFRREATGAIATRVDRGIGGCGGMVNEIAFRLVPNICYLAISLVAMYLLDWRLFLFVALLVPAPILIALAAAGEQTRRERTLVAMWAAVYGRFHEVLGALPLVKSFAMESAERRRFMRGVRGAHAIALRGVARDTVIGGASSLVTAFGRFGGAALGILLVIRGETSVGTVVAFMGYIGGLFGPIQGLAGSYLSWRRAAVSVDGLFDILDTPDALQERRRAAALPAVRGHVEFDGVTFGYDPARPVIHDVRLAVEPGQAVALVGPSGAGKTTLMHLLQRFDDPTHGRLLLDGTDLRTLQFRTLRRNMAAVHQDNVLFNDSVRANIAYGRPGASAAEVRRAADAAGALGFIEALPRGFDTIVGERGVKLSVGQRQRIAIARAVLMDPRILILDEATSALDAEAEALVQGALDRLMAGRTTFLIAHRLVTVSQASLIVVVDGGRIRERGTPEELMRRETYYAAMVRKQGTTLPLPDLVLPGLGGAPTPMTLQ